MYLSKHVQEALEHFITTDFNREIQLTSNVKLIFKEAGHLLGAASALIEYEEKDEVKRIVFSGDIGRETYPLLVSPAEIPPVDYLVCETTYGNRIHRDLEPPAELLKKFTQIIQ